MKINKMTTALRLTKLEQKKLKQKTKEINKILINNDQEALQEHEILHIALDLALEKIKAKENGEITIQTQV